MSVSNPNKTVSNSILACDGLTTVTLSFDAAAELRANPADIVLIMDRSSSIQGVDLIAAKAAARQLIETVAKASGSTDGTEILNASRMSVVAFSDTAVTAIGLTNDVPGLNAAIRGISASGYTNHKSAFELARTILEPSSSPRRIVIMFTDGVTTMGGDAAPAAEAIRAEGMEIYCIGLGASLAPLDLWASEPVSTHVAHAENKSELDEAFAKIASEVVLAGAVDTVVHEVLNPDFKITNVNIPTHGTVNVINPQTLEWKASAVGSAGMETASLTFEVMHVGSTFGTKSVNQSITYTDRQGATLTFPDPQVLITCDGPVVTEPCPVPTQFYLERCQDAAAIDTNDVLLTGLGRIVQVNALVKNVCPGKRVAVAIILTELDAEGNEYNRGVKTVLVPPHSCRCCRDVQLKCISFVVPEALDVDGSTDSICNCRKFNVRVLANYVDTDFVCCEAEAATV